MSTPVTVPHALDRHMRPLMLLATVVAGWLACGCLTEPPHLPADPPQNSTAPMRASSRPKTPQELAVAAIKKMRGSVAVDPPPGNAVSGVDLNHTRVNDKTLSCI